MSFGGLALTRQDLFRPNSQAFSDVSLLTAVHQTAGVPSTEIFSSAVVSCILQPYGVKVSLLA